MSNLLLANNFLPDKGSHLHTAAERFDLEFLVRAMGIVVRKSEAEQ